jgi:ribosome modulation factor
MYQPATINGVKQWAFLTGQSTAIAIDPTTGDPWASNETRTARKAGYGRIPNGWDVAMWPPYDTTDERRSWLDVWPDALTPDYDAMNPAYVDMVTSLSFCDDGTLWIASALHGLARRAPNGSISYVDLPSGLGNSASAVACDPSDGSVWVGFGWGGFGRYDGSWHVPDGTKAPRFASSAPVANIQIDRWASPRIVYIAQQASRQGPGGVTVYRGK